MDRSINEFATSENFTTVSRIESSVSGADYFIDYDSATFSHLAGTPAPGQVDETYGVTVSDMVVTAGGYIFEGGKITGDATETTLPDKNGKLTLTDTGATTFRNEIDFNGGISIGTEYVIALDYSSDRLRRDGLKIHDTATGADVHGARLAVVGAPVTDVRHRPRSVPGIAALKVNISQAGRQIGTSTSPDLSNADADFLRFRPAGATVHVARNLVTK